MASEPNKVQGSWLSFMTLKGDANLQEKLTYGLENHMANMANFHQNNLKSQNWDNDGIL